MKIYNPFSKESYDSNFSPTKLINNCTQATSLSKNENVYFDLKKIVFVIKNYNVRKRYITCNKRN